MYKKLLNIQNELKAPKSQYNNFGKYKYRNCEDILESLKPLLEKNNATITMSDDIIVVNERYYVKSIVTFIDCETGNTISTQALAREEISKKGMDSSQITGAASSYARKYALNGMFCIDDTKDSDTTNVNVSDKKSDVNNPPASKTSWVTVTDKQIKRLYEIAKTVSVSHDDIKVWINNKFNLDHINELNNSQYDELCNALGKKK